MGYREFDGQLDAEPTGSGFVEFTGKLDAAPFDSLVSAIRGRESGGDPNAISPQGAKGSMQIMPATFKEYAAPGESFDNDEHRTNAALRKLRADFDFYGGDVAKTAAAYLGGRGAVRADGTIRDDVKDAHGTTPAAYAQQVVQRMGTTPAAAAVNRPPARKNVMGIAFPSQDELKPLGPVEQTPPASTELGGWDTAKLIGGQILDAALYHLPAAFAAALEGDDPYAEKDWKDSLIERSRERSKSTAAPGDKDAKTALPGVSAQDVKQLGPSLGFSGVGAGAGLAAGVPAGIAGNLAAPAVGTAAGYTAGMAASGAAAYRMASNQFVRDLHDAANEDSLQRTGKPITDAEFQQKQAQLAGLIKEYGLWEAVPEAAGNALGFGILKAPVKGAIGKLFGSNILTRLASKMGALYGEELATETVTQQGQHNVEVDAGLSKDPKRSWTSPEDLAQSFKEVATSTILQTTLMAGGAKAGMKAYDRLRGEQLQAAPAAAPGEAADSINVSDLYGEPEAAGSQFANREPMPVQPEAMGMQNRDRGTAASILQMQSIANAPDFDRLGASPIPDVGAPMVSIKDNADGAIAPEDLGQGGEVTLPDGSKVGFHYAVLDADLVQASHDAAGNVNPAYADAPAGTVVALNNGRTAGLQAAYATGTAAQPGGYRDRLMSEAQSFGIDPQAVAGKASPILVRVYDDAVNSRPDIARQANSGGSMGMSAQEVARNDAAVLPDLRNLVVDENGEFDPRANAPFVRGWVGSLPQSEQAQVTDRGGNLSQVGATRLRNAIIARAYGDNSVFGRLVESLDDNMRNVGRALVKAAPKIAQVRELIAAGAAHDLDIGGEINRAVDDLVKLRQAGMSLADFLAQANLFAEQKTAPEVLEILAFLDANLRSPNRIADFLSGYYAQVEAMGSPQQGDMFGAPQLQRGDLIRNAKAATLPPAGLFEGDHGRRDEPGRADSGSPAEIGTVAADAAGNAGGETAPAIPGADGSGGEIRGGSAGTAGSGERAGQPAAVAEPKTAVGKEARKLKERAAKNRQPAKSGEKSPGGQPATATEPEKPADGFGAGNKVFTADRAAKARELLRKKLGQVNSGLDPEMVQAGIELAGFYIEGGARTFADYAGKMVADLGEAARPYLKSWYLAVRNYPGFDNAGMESEAELEAAEKRTALKADIEKIKAKREPALAYADGQVLPFDKVDGFLSQYVYGRERGDQVPNPTFIVGQLSAPAIETIGEFIDGFGEQYSTVRVSGRSLKHTDEQRHDLFSAVVGKLPEILAAPDLEVLHNPSREASAFIVYRRPKVEGPNALVVIEIAKNGNGTDIVNMISAGDRQVRQFERRSAEWLEGRHSLIPAAERSPAGGEVSDVQPLSNENVAPEKADGNTVDAAAHEAATSPKNGKPEPTQAQKEAGNYPKGHVRIAGLDIAIENPEGSKRSGTDPNGKAWEVTMQSHYGYIKGTVGKDKDHVDVFVKPGTPEDYAGPVFVIDQKKANGHFDEHKVMIGWKLQDAAVLAYKANYAKGWKGLGAVTRMSVDEFKSWLKSGDLTQMASAAIAPTMNDKEEKGNVTDQRSGTDLERDRQDAGAKDRMGAEGLRPGRDGDGGTGGPRVQGREGDDGAGGGGELSGRETAPAGERGNIEIYTGAPELSPGAAGNRVDQRGGDPGIPGAPIEPDAARAIAEVARSGLRQDRGRLEQQKADRQPYGAGLEEIRKALPILTEGQHEDVVKAEARFAVPDGYGMLFTNGTGTGKTFTGLGTIKRFANQGKTSILVVAPNDKIIEDWQKSGKMLGLDITRLPGTNDAGRGIVITTYANMGQNNELAKRDWDLIVTDEAHYLTMDKDGKPTSFIKNLRAISLHPDGVFDRAEAIHADLRAEIERLAAEAKRLRASDDERDWHAEPAVSKKLDAKVAEMKAKQDAIKEDVKARQGVKRSRVLFLSATPFAYEKTIDWANGYLFDYDEGQPSEEGSSRGYNAGSNRERFFMQHFGYRMRYNKLTEPDAKVDRGLMQRQFNTWMKKRGALSGRMLDVAADYDRKFILVESAIGQRIDEALQWFEAQRKARQGDGLTGAAGERIGQHLGKIDPYVQALGSVRDTLAEKFDYLSRRYLLEAIKAREVIPHVKEHMALGRKVVVFHDYKKGGGFNPFNLAEVDGNGSNKEEQERIDQYNAVVRAFRKEFKDLIESDEFNASSPIAAFKREFPSVLLFNGDVPAKERRANVAKFQDDASGPQVILVQSAAGKEGISLHDTTGKHQRVLFNLGQPTQPTTAIQQEGRIYRTGQVTDAIFRYLNTGTNWEKWAFATTIANRASAAENLGMGELARALKDAFIAGFEESGDYRAGMEGEGKGGKERDRAANEALSEYDRAKAFYFGTQKKNSKTKAQEGADYFATPEPVGLKMVEFADIRPGEDVLEPSAGHGAIARWFPETAEKTAIEPSMALRPRLAMVFDGNILDQDFEGLNVVNKYDAIAMNPPFGTGGRMAVEHLEKATHHLRDGGRVVALIPTGPAADKRFDKWFYDEATRPVKPLFEHPTLGPIYRGDTVSTRASWMPEGKLARRDRDGNLWLKRDGENSESMVTPQAFTAVKATGKRTETYRPAENLYLVADIKLPGVTFERAGTGVMTRIVVIEKQADAAKAPAQVHNRDLTGVEDINELFDRMENIAMPKRPKPEEAEPEAKVPRQKDEAKRANTEALPESGQVQPSGEAATIETVQGDKLLTDAPRVEYVTQKGKTIYGVIAKTLTKDEAKAIDAYSWKKDGGYFIRMAHVVRPGGQESRSFQSVRPRGGIARALYDMVKSTTDAFRRQFRGAAALDIRVVYSREEIPPHHRPSPYAEGVYHDTEGVIYLVAKNLPTKLRAWQVLMHETVGHYSLSSLMGEKFSDLWQTVLSQASSGRDLNHDPAPGEADYETVEAVRRLYPEAADNEVAQEVLARMAETMSPPNWVRSILASIRQWLKSVAEAIGVKLEPSLKDARDLVVLAAEHLREGRNLEREQSGQALVFASRRGAESRASTTSSQPSAGRRMPPQEVDAKVAAILSKRRGTPALEAVLKGATKAAGIDRATAFAGAKVRQMLDALVPEGIKAGMVADYGVPQAVTDRRDVMFGHMRRQLRDVENTLLRLSTLTRQESRVAYEWMNNRGADHLLEGLPEESRQVLQELKRAITEMSKEAVHLGQLDADTFERHAMAYLHRSYSKWELETTDAEKRTRAKAIKVLGDQYKGRGLTDTPTMAAIRNAAPDWWNRKTQGGKADKQLRGQKFIRFERRANRGEGAGLLPGMEGTGQLGKLLEVHYWPASEPVPAKYGAWHNARSWEVRDTKGDKVVVWRDFTPEERTAMGEIDEVRFAVAKTLHKMIHDLEVGKFFEWLASDQALPEDRLPRTARVVDARESLMATFGQGDWVQVPDSAIPGTRVKRYGKLAGLYVPGPVWNDIRQIANVRYAPLGEHYAAILKAWKISKTALSPAVHLNNIMANFVMADWHDVSWTDTLDALRVLVRPDEPAHKQILERFEDAGGSQGMFVLSEIQREQLAPLIDQLRQEVGLADAEGQIGAASILQAAMRGRVVDAFQQIGMTRAGRLSAKAVEKVMDVYHSEDTVFRLAAFMKAKREGTSDMDAGRAARKSFLDYQINAPWVQMLRQTAFPFVAFTYRAVPMLLNTIEKKPWKLLKLGLALGALNALGYAFSGGDEDRERKLLPEEKAGRVLGGVAPKLIRMPWNHEMVDRAGNKSMAPVFLDIRRFIPMGDIVDMGQTHAAVPVLPMAIPGGPLAVLAELIANKSQFTGKVVTQETDTSTEKAWKVLDHLYKAFAPNLVGLPGTYATTGVWNAGTGRTDAFGREQSLAMAGLSSVGVKLGAYPADVARMNIGLEFKAEQQEIRANMRRAGREFSRGGMDREEFDKTIKTEQEKLRERGAKVADRLQ